MEIWLYKKLDSKDLPAMILRKDRRNLMGCTRPDNYTRKNQGLGYRMGTQTHTQTQNQKPNIYGYQT